MLNLLHHRRRLGLVSSRSVADYIEEQQCLQLTLASNVHIVQRRQGGGTLTMDIDAAEGRYLLTGSTNRRIAINDLGAEPAAWQRSSKPSACAIVAHTKGHKGAVAKVTWYPQDSGAFVSSGTDGSVKLWGRCRRYDVCKSADLAASLDTNSMTAVEEFAGFDVVYNHAISITPQQCLVAVACKHRDVYLCDVRSGSKTHTLRGHTKAVLTADWSPQLEHVLATGGVDNRILLWDIRRAKSCLAALDVDNGDALATFNATTRPIAHHGPVNCVRFTKDGHRLVSSGGDDHVRVWNTDTTKHNLAHFNRIRNRLRFFQFALLERGPQVYLYHPNGAVIGVYRLSDGKLLRQFRAHYSDIYCLQLHPQQQLLLSGSNDTEVLAWQPRGKEQGLIQHLDEDGLEQLPMVHEEDAWSDDD
jgi:DNA excision repair protein ERCC-8